MGFNDFGQLGLGHKISPHHLSKLSDIPKINYLACGNHNTNCIDTKGCVWFWL